MMNNNVMLLFLHFILMQSGALSSLQKKNRFCNSNYTPTSRHMSQQHFPGR